ncbi:MAG: hypothetical protein AAF607_17095 [Pseudomonadota bacterium]
MLPNTDRSAPIFRSCCVAAALLFLPFASPVRAAPPAEQALPQIKEIFYASIETWEDYLQYADELQDVLWTQSKLSKIETWEIFLQNALAAENPSLEALAQHKLVALGLSEDRMRDLYRLDEGALSKPDSARLRFSQRAGLLPVKINAADIAELRLHFDDREIVDIMLVNSYGATLNVLYGTGYVADPALHPKPLFTNFAPQRKALRQKKQETSSGFQKRQFFESPILSPKLSFPYLGWDWMIFNEHVFDVGTTWEHFLVGMKASDCKHCQTHGALGMLYHGRTHEEIQKTYLFDTGTEFDDRKTASFSFIKSALTLPSQIDDQTIADLERNFSDTEVDHLVGIAAVMAFLSNYMQISAVVTDQESVNFADEVLSPVGWHLGRHAGWPEEQRAMHPTTLFRLTEGEDEVAKNLMFYRNSFMPVLVQYWGGKLIGPVVLIVFEILMAFLLLSRIAQLPKPPGLVSRHRASAPRVATGLISQHVHVADVAAE